MTTTPAERQEPYLDLAADQPTDLAQAAKAAATLEQRKKLTTRMRNYGETLQVKIEARMTKEGSDEEVSQLNFIRKAVLWAFRKVVLGGAWLLDQIEKLANWISDLLGTAARPITSTYTKVKTWIVGAEQHELAAA